MTIFTFIRTALMTTSPYIQQYHYSCHLLDFGWTDLFSCIVRNQFTGMKR